MRKPKPQAVVMNISFYLLGGDRAEMPGPLVQVCGFCNVGRPVTLSVNGRVIGEKEPDEVKTVLWLGVPVVTGANRIELTCGGLTASAVWHVREEHAGLSVSRGAGENRKEFCE